MVLVLAVVVGIMAEVAVLTTSRVVQAAKEQELLFRGNAYLSAIESFYLAVAGSPEYPARIDDLLMDPRFLHRRHLSRAYEDPFGSEWSLLRNERGRIMGVASKSRKKPYKSANFPLRYQHFEGSEEIKEWQFIYLPD